MSKLNITNPSIGGGSGQGSALNYSQQAGTSVTVADIGAVITGVEMMTTGKPVQISVTGEAANAEASSWIVIQLMDGPSPIGNAIQIEASAVSENVPYALNFIHTAEAGGHDFHLKVIDKSPGSWVFGEAGGPVFNAVELTGFKGDNGSGADVGNFIFSGNSISTNEDMIVAVNGVPGSINLSAYAGVNLQFAVGEGIGLKFPDNTIQTTAYTGNGGSSDIADFIFTQDEGQSVISLPNNRQMRIQGGEDSDLYLTAGDDLFIQTLGYGDDINLNSADDIRFTTNNEDSETGIVPQWIMNSEGIFHLPGGGYIENPTNNSGDGYQNDTLKLVPDEDLTWEGGDQYIVIDPTSPNHIHIRAGGTPDASTADLFLGGEKNKVQISDQYNQVQISTKQGSTTNEYQNLNTEISTQFIISSTTPVDYGYIVNVNGTGYVVDSINDDTPEVGLRTLMASGAQFDPNGWYEFTYQPDGNYNWTFTQSGLLLGPAQGFLNVTGFVTPQSYDLALNADSSVVLAGNNGEFLNDPNIAQNQIATIGDVTNYAPIETEFTVNGGSLGTMPTFDGVPLFSGTYVKIGPQVHFQIQVNMDNITSFGSGQYYVDLPFDAKYGYQFKEGCLHDISTSNQFAIGGHVYAGTNRLFLTYTGSNGQDEMFTHNSPVGLNAADNFHIAGTYISA